MKHTWFPSLVFKFMLSKRSLLHNYSAMTAFWTSITLLPKCACTEWYITKINIYAQHTEMQEGFLLLRWHYSLSLPEAERKQFSKSLTLALAFIVSKDTESGARRLLKNWRTQGWATMKALEFWGQLCQPTCNTGLSVFIMVFPQQKGA